MTAKVSWPMTSLKAMRRQDCDLCIWTQSEKEKETTNNKYILCILWDRLWGKKYKWENIKELKDIYRCNYWIERLFFFFWGIVKSMGDWKGLSLSLSICLYIYIIFTQFSNFEETFKTYKYIKSTSVYRNLMAWPLYASRL